MKRIALALALLAAPAFAQNSATLERRGHWSSFVARTSSNTVICGIDVIDPNDGRHMMIKWFQGSNRLVFHVTHPRWGMNVGRSIPISFQVEGYNGWTAFGTAMNPNTIEFWISASNLDRFEPQFRMGHRMFLSFPWTGEPYWTISLYGSNAIIGSLLECMRSVGG